MCDKPKVAVVGGASASQAIAKLLEESGMPVEVIDVEMLGTKEVGNFISMIEEAHKNAGNSKVRYKK